MSCFAMGGCGELSAVDARDTVQRLVFDREPEVYCPVRLLELEQPLSGKHRGKHLVKAPPRRPAAFDDCVAALARRGRLRSVRHGNIYVVTPGQGGRVDGPTLSVSCGERALQQIVEVRQKDGHAEVTYLQTVTLDEGRVSPFAMCELERPPTGKGLLATLALRRNEEGEWERR